MVRKVNKIDKKNYKKESKTNYIIIGLATVAIIAVVMYMGMGGTSGGALAGSAPSGNNCAENVAYLQTGVDMYKEEVGNYPQNVQELLKTVDGKGPFVEVIPECPTGNIYVISDGIVREVPNQ